MSWRLGRPSILTLVGAGFVVWGLSIGLHPLKDNSFLTHLATGRLILDRGIPRRDPYSFTAPGHPWVVQSWVPSLLYAQLERSFGAGALVVLYGLQTGALAAVAWLVTRPANTLIGRILVMTAVLIVGVNTWSSRPLLFGLLMLGVTIVLAEGDRGSPWWLVPVGWLWVNAHGSFPFGIGYLAVRLVGRRLDGGPTDRLLRLLGCSVLGVLVGAVNPLGPKLLVFPVNLLLHHKALAHIIEWRSPQFNGLANLVFLGEVLVALLLLGRRRSWEDGLIAVVFTALGMIAVRNAAVASLVVAPVLARGLAGLGQVSGARRSPLASVGVVAFAGLALVLGLVAASRPAFNLRDYPVADLEWMGTQGLLQRRVATQDFVGNLRDLREGPRRRVFIDDRYDMYPGRVVDDSFDLLLGVPRWQAILARYRVDTVLWSRKETLAGLLVLDPDWVVVRRSRHWLVAVRKDMCPGSLCGTRGTESVGG